MNRRSPWRAVLVAAAALLLWEPGHALAQSRRTVVFAPDRPNRCDYFFVTEFNATATGANSQDAVDRFLFTDAVGIMRNIDGSRAVGLSLDAHLTAGELRFAPTVRFKQWLGGRSSLDVLFGYATDSPEKEGVVGPVMDVRYSPTAWFHLQAGACRIRNVTSIWYYPEYRVEGNTRFEFHAGVGLGGVPGVVSWGAQAVGAAVLVSLLSGMD